MQKLYQAGNFVAAPVLTQTKFPDKTARNGTVREGSIDRPLLEMNRCFHRSSLACAILWIGATALAYAQAGSTSSGSLSVTMEVQSSISLEFVNNGSGVGYCQLTGSGTSSASLNLGIASMSGDTLDSENGGCVNWYTSGSSYNILNYVYVEVTETNSSSASFNLSAALASAPPTGVTWKFESMSGNLSTTSQTVATDVSYASAYGLQLAVTVANTVASGSIGAAIDFTATAN